MDPTETADVVLWFPLNQGGTMLTIAQAAKILACSTPYIRKLLKKGELRHIRHGRFVRIFEDAVREYLERHTKGKGVALPPPVPRNGTPTPGLHIR